MRLQYQDALSFRILIGLLVFPVFIPVISQNPNGFEQFDVAELLARRAAPG